MTADVRPYGRTALLVEPREEADVLPFATAARALPGVAEVVPAARTLLVVCASGSDADRLASELPTLRIDRDASERTDAAATVEIDVVYDGPDLDAVAAEVGLTRDDVVRQHTGAHYVVACCGFVPGFAYLRGLAPDLQLPRLAEPRTRVPAGAVGIAGEFTGVYPRASPGGWRLLGRTDALLWELARNPPALLTPGTRVRFRTS